MNDKDILNTLLHQLSGYWESYDVNILEACVPVALNRVEEDFIASALGRVFDGDKVIFSPYHSVTWSIFLYYLSNTIFRNNGEVKKADMIYYLNKIMNSNDWFYPISLPIHFMAEHVIGSVLGRATYGDYLFIYQGVTIGGNWRNGKLFYPTLGTNVLMYANSTVLGDTFIGNNVIIAADSYIINEVIPDNCIVFGKSPNIELKIKSEEYIKDRTSCIWKW